MSKTNKELTAELQAAKIDLGIAQDELDGIYEREDVIRTQLSKVDVSILGIAAKAAHEARVQLIADMFSLDDPDDV